MNTKMKITKRQLRRIIKEARPVGFRVGRARWASNREANQSMNNLRMDVEEAHNWLTRLEDAQQMVPMRAQKIRKQKDRWQDAAQRYIDAWEEYSTMGFSGHQYQAGEGDPYKYLVEAEGSTKKYDDDSALRGGQSKLPDGLQKGIIDKTVEDREEHEEEDRKEKNESARITRRQLRRIIKEQMASKKIQQVAVEWELGDHDSAEGFDNLPPIVKLPSSVMAEYRADLAEYGEQDAAHVISNWLDDTFGWMSQWNFIGPVREAGMHLTGKGWKDPGPGEADLLWPRPKAFDHNHPEYAGEMAAVDYSAGKLDAKSGRPMLPNASDDYAAGYEDGLETLPLQELGKSWQLSSGACDTHNISPNDAAEAMAVLQEFGYELGLPPAVDLNSMAINDALAAYPGEFSYEDFLCAIRVVQGR